jgi:hypothetical protein
MFNPKSKIQNPESTLALLSVLLLSLHARAAITATAVLPSADSRIVWEPELRIKSAERVFTSRHDINRVWVGTPQGIQESLDAGANWTLIPNSNLLGRITAVVFSPASSDIIFVATRDKGIFRSNDNGKTFQNVGTPQSGLKSLHIVRLLCEPTDQASRIVYAAYGDAAPGFAKSVDGGNTWFTLASNYVVQELLLERRELWMGGHVVDDEDNWAIYGSSDGGETFTEDQRDVRTTTAGLPRIGVGTIWFGALKGPLMYRPPLERHRNFGDWRKAGPESGEWASIFGTFGRTFQEDMLFAYDPHQHGLVCSPDGFKTWWPENTNLFVGKFVKEGANICCSATGRTFYASINSELYIGRLTDRVADGPIISNFTVTPSVVRAAKGTPITLSVKVLPFDKDAKSAIKLVHVNLTAIRGPGNFNLTADAARPGFYTGTFACTDEYTNMWNPGDHRLHIPGQTLVMANAQDNKNRVTSETIPITLFAKPNSFYFWDGETVKEGAHMTDGRRTTSFDGRHGDIFNMAVEAHSGTHCLHVVATSGPWVVGWGSDQNGRNLSDTDYLVFWIKTKAVSKRDIKILLTDTPGGESDARQSDPVWLIKDGYLKELSTEYQRVRIPLAKFMAKTGGFCMDLVGGVAFGGDDATGHSFYVDDIGFEVEGSPLK